MNHFDLSGKVIAMTGGTGVLGSEMALGFAQAGAKLAILGRSKEKCDQLVSSLGSDHLGIEVDILSREGISKGLDQIIHKFGQVDVLVNMAGGNHPKSTTGPDMPFFDIPKESFEFATELNLTGTVIPSQIFGKHMAERGQGNILNVSSMSAVLPLTRIPAYSAAKAAVSNFTQWLAVHLAQEYSSALRVNALAPGFFLTEQNRFLLTDRETGELTARGKKITDHTPMGRFGAPEDLLGAAIWLVSDASKFVTGIVVPVDGGFSAYSGV